MDLKFVNFRKTGFSDRKLKAQFFMKQLFKQGFQLEIKNVGLFKLKLLSKLEKWFGPGNRFQTWSFKIGFNFAKNFNLFQDEEGEKIVSSAEMTKKRNDFNIFTNLVTLFR